MYSRSVNKFTIQPVPFSVFDPAPSLPSGNAEIIIQPTSPYYPHQFAADNGVDGQPLGVLYRCVLCGNRANQDTNDAWQIVAGIKGTAWNWDWDASFNYSANTSKEQPRNGFFQYTQIVPLLNTLVTPVSTRSAPAGFCAAGDQRAAVHRHNRGQQARWLRHRPQGDRRNLRSAGWPRRRRGRVSGG
jgi:hypothetical protein